MTDTTIGRLTYDGMFIPHGKRQLLVRPEEKNDVEECRVYSYILHRILQIYPNGSDLSNLEDGGPYDNTWPQHKHDQLVRLEQVFTEIHLWDELEAIECSENKCDIYEIPGTELIVIASDKETITALKNIGIFFENEYK
jgi:hypothetical protein